MVDIRVSRKPLNPPALAAEMNAVIGEAWQGWSAHRDEPGEYRLHVADGAPQATIEAAIQAYATHDPAALTADQRAEQARADAVMRLAQANPAALRKGAEAARSLDELRPLLLGAIDMLQLLMLAAGLTDANNPEG